jgi:D-xylose transport system substrate-binding protein
MKRFAALAATALAALALGACGDDDDDSGDSGGGGGGKIAFLLPENQTTRYEAQDKPLFEAKVEELCPDCEILYSNATQDAAKQQQQAEAALAQDVDVMVLDPVDSAAAAAIVNQANAKDVPVISYDRLLLNSEPDYYVEFDSPAVGRIQGNALVDKLQEDGKKGGIVMINGAPTDNNAKLFKEGAHSVIDSSPYEVLKEYDTAEWLPENAQREMDQSIASLGKDGFVGVYAANDGTAGGAIAALKGAGIDPSTVPVTGQDAELAAIQRILAGEQYMTVYKPVKPLAERAADWAVKLVNGEEITDATDTENNGKIDVPSAIHDVEPVTADQVKDTVVADGFLKVSDICTGEYAAACKKYGIE